MKAFTTILTLLALVALAQASCLASSYCKTCTSNLCASCPTTSSFYKGPMMLASGICSARTTAQKVPVNADQVQAYLAGSASSFSTTIDPVICKSGYYAFNDGITANAPTSLTNCNYITSYYNANNKFWTCTECNSGYTLSNALLSNASCASGVTITNCDKGVLSSGTNTCAECKSGYVRANNEQSCVAETTATKNCSKLDSTGLLCEECDTQSYFNTTVCVNAAFLKTIAALLLAVMVYLQ